MTVRRQYAIDKLRETGWLSRQPTAFQDEVLRNAELRSYPDGVTIQIVGDEPAGLFGLAAGLLSVTIAPPALPHHLVQIARPGWWFGDVALLSDAGRVVTISGRGPVEILTVSRTAILRLAEQDSTTWKRIGQITVMHLDQALRIIAAMSIPKPELRLAFALARLTEGYAQDHDAPVEIPVTQSELGEMARMTRNAVVPTLRKLEKLGLITCTYRRVSLHSVLGLWQFIGTTTGYTSDDLARD